LVRTTPGTPGETVWIAFLDRIEPDETVTDWLVQGPNIDRLEPDDRQKALSDIASIATCLRKLRVNLMGMSPKKGLLRGFNHGIWARLEQAAAFITKNDQEHLQLAWWELQMALEASLKALALAKTGEFRRRHGIIDLFAAITGETDFAFDVDRFQVWPSWREMNEMRYGRGRSVNRLATVDAYGLVLELAEAATKAMVVWRFGQFRIEVRKAPWLEATSSS